MQVELLGKLALKGRICAASFRGRVVDNQPIDVGGSWAVIVQAGRLGRRPEPGNLMHSFSPKAID